MRNPRSFIRWNDRLSRWELWTTDTVLLAIADWETLKAIGEADRDYPLDLAISDKPHGMGQRFIRFIQRGGAKR